MRAGKGSLEDAVARLAERTKVDPDSGCWVYSPARLKGGYAQFTAQGKLTLVHRFAYELFVGPIGDMTVDHLCFEPACVNPAHLRLMSMRANAANQRRRNDDACQKGHERTPENLGHKATGARYCRQCCRDSAARSADRKKTNNTNRKAA